VPPNGKPRGGTVQPNGKRGFMKKFLQRILVFLVGIPLFVGLTLFLPQKNHLTLNLVVVALCALGARELADMLNKKKLPVNRWEATALGALCPLVETVTVSFFPGFSLTFAVFIAGLSWVLASRVFAAPEKLEDGLNRIASGIMAVCYPGLFMIPFIRMGALYQAGPVLLVFLLIVFGNDACAWATGMLLGKNNRGILAASPNKSVAGFVGGFVISLVTGILAVYLAPKAFVSRSLSPLPAGALLGILSSAAASLGDLAESVMKRSAGIKDSGHIIPGRGGVLDSLDSIAFTAPIFYGLYRLLFMP
jgi:phosphatidate cytidylyltransferase